MNENALTVIRARGSEKQACDEGGKKPPRKLRYTVAKKPKKAVIEKVSGVSTPSDVVDVDVERVDRTTIRELHAALENLPEKQAAAGMSKILAVLKRLIGSRGMLGQAAAGVGRPVGRALAPMAAMPTTGVADLKALLKSHPLLALKGGGRNLLQSLGTLGGKATGTSATARGLGAGVLGGGGLAAAGLGRATKGESKPKEKEEKKPEKKASVKEAAGTLGTRLAGLKAALKQVFGVAALGGGMGTGLGAISGVINPEEDKGRLLSALRRAIAYGGTGTLAGAGAGIGGSLAPTGLMGTILGGSLGGSAGVSAMDKLLGGQAILPKHMGRKAASASAQDTKKKDKDDETKPGVVKLESASDTPPKKAPVKKPDEESENKVEYDEKTAAATGIASPLLSILKQLVGAKGLPRQLTRGVGVPVAHRIGALSKIQGGGAVKSLLKGIGTAAKPVGAGAAGTAGRASLVGAGTLGLGGLGIHAAGRRTGAKEKEEELAGKGDNTAALTDILTTLVTQRASGGGAPGMAPSGGMGMERSKWGSFSTMLKRALSGMGQPETPLKASTDLPRRNGNRTTNRQEVFEDLARWSLGARL